MTTKGPRQLNAPKLEDYPFITLMLRNDVNAFIAADGGTSMGDSILRSRIGETHFYWPSDIKPETLDILHGMSDHTFEGLCSALGPKYDDFAVKSKADLFDLAERRQRYVKPDPDEGLGDYDLDQLQSYLFFATEISRNIHWGNFVNFFNTSSVEQQQVIEQYFSIYHGQALDTLLAHAVMQIEVPEILQEVYESREHAGNTYHFSKDMGKWLREDRFHQQYRVDVTMQGSSFSFIRASAPTLKMAIAKATCIALDFDENLVMGRVEILQGGVPVMHAEMVYSERAPAADVSCKLRWDFENIGPDKTHLKNNQRYSELSANDYKGEAKKDMQEHAAKLKALIEAKPPFPAHVLQKTVLDVERKLKLQWSKVYRLEDDLGL